MTEARAVIAVVGRPNVGKSTIFNRFVGRPLAVVDDRPGVTRDRNIAEAILIGRPVLMIDTGGFDPESEDPLMESIARQVELALDAADVVMCVLDATSGPMPADREAVALLRKTKKPVFFVANKADSPKRGLEATSLYELGIPRLWPVSALHGHGLGELEDEIVAALPKLSAEESPHQGVPRVAVIGRPNAGKSSLVNRLLKQERQVVDARPGTTVDSIDSWFEWEGTPIVLTDTAGIRRRRSVERGMESFAVMQAVHALERSDVAVLMIDANELPAEQDAKIAALVKDRGCGLVLALNKWDLLNAEQKKHAAQRLKDILGFVDWAPQVRLSVKEGRGLRELMESLLRVIEARKQRVPTGEINRFFSDVLEKHPPPARQAKPVRLYYITQAHTAPPVFVAMANRPEAVHESYQRYVVNQIRARFGFEGTPIRVAYRARRRTRDAESE